MFVDDHRKNISRSKGVFGLESRFERVNLR